MARWKIGETGYQRRVRQSHWHKVFAFLPNRADTGELVWMRHFWRKRRWTFGPSLIGEEKRLDKPTEMVTIMLHSRKEP